MPSNEYSGQSPWLVIVAIILTAVLSWATQAWLYRAKRIDAQYKRKTDQADANQKRENDQADRLIIHRDELTFELLQNARLEMASARVEVEDLRNEVKQLRSMENHFYHFQQSLDHIEALLFSTTPEAKAIAERNARAFLMRMRRLSEAKGTIVNETQIAVSGAHLLGDSPVVKPKDGKDG